MTEAKKFLSVSHSINKAKPDILIHLTRHYAEMQNIGIFANEHIIQSYLKRP